jgi:hypothetical protein
LERKQSLAMRHLFLPLFALIAACVSAHARAAIASGQPAADFTFTDLAGKSRTLSEFRGKVVVLEWLNPACPYVVRHYKSGNLPATQAAAAADGVIWLQINSNASGDLDPAASAAWQKKQGVTATAYIRDQDGRIGRLYDARNTPHLYVIARDGTLAYQGAIDDQPNGSVATVDSAHNYVKAALAALKASRPVKTAATAPYGCQIKYGSP